MMKKLATAGLALSVLGVSLAAAPLTAEAVSTQKLCSSKHSTADISIYSKKYKKYYGLDAPPSAFGCPGAMPSST